MSMTAYLWRCDLKDWVLLKVTAGDQAEYIQGEVARDNRGRFAPGTYVYSSEIDKRVGDWQDLDTPDEGRHLQTAGDTHFYPVGPGRIVEVSQATADRIRAGQDMDDAFKEVKNGSAGG